MSYKVIDSKHYGSPQSRQRIYIICDKHKKYKFRSINRPITPVSTIIDHTVSDFFNYEDKYTLQASNGRMKYSLINKKTGKGGRQGERVYSMDQRYVRHRGVLVQKQDCTKLMVRLEN